MSLELGLILTFAIVAVGGVGLAGFMLWLRNRESNANHHDHREKLA
ncbi:MAG: hypothetical protein HOP24_06540 [Sideroxydans sp.]|nr:hypothetical protein [Sideroxydans sp.]